MYSNLKAELMRKGLSQKELAEGLMITRSTVNRKINGLSDWTLSEAVTIKEDILGVDIPLEQLFAND